MSTARALAFLFALFAMTASAGAQDARRILTTENGDYYGFDLRSEQDVSLDQCSAACLGDPQCRAFTYNTRARWCFLKSDFATLNTFQGAVAGKVVDASAEPDIGAPPPLGFVPAYLLQDAEQYRREVAGNESTRDSGLFALASAANDALSRGDGNSAFADYMSAVSIEPENASLWTGLAGAALAARPNETLSTYGLQRAATGAALTAYRLSRSAHDRATALAVLAAALEKREFFRPAISAYEASLAIEASPEVQARYAELKRDKGFRVVDHSIDSDSATPRVCIQFSEDLAKSGIDYAQYLSLDNGRPAAVDKSDRELCVSGLSHGERYRIVVRQGLPAAIGEVIQQPVPLEVYVRDRAPAVRFTGDNFVLPTSARRGIPLVSVNTPAADLSLYRIGERALTQLLAQSNFLRQLNQYEIGELAGDLGSPSGKALSRSPPNRTRTSSSASRWTRWCRSGSPVSTCSPRFPKGTAARPGTPARHSGSSCPISGLPPMPATMASRSSPARWRRPGPSQTSR
jgi:alpha-2-macroglobulin